MTLDFFLVLWVADGGLNHVTMSVRTISLLPFFLFFSSHHTTNYGIVKKVWKVKSKRKKENNSPFSHQRRGHECKERRVDLGRTARPALGLTQKPERAVALVVVV